MVESISLALAVGKRARELRLEREATLDDLAHAMRALGFRWSTSRVVELETGKVAPTLGNLLGLTSALTILRSPSSGGSVQLSDLLPASGTVDIAPGVTVSAESLREALAGSGVLATIVATERLEALTEKSNRAVERATRLRGKSWSWTRGIELEDRQTLADQRAAATLGVSMPELITAAQALWNDTLTGERDRRGDPNDSPQRRGRITRDLITELSSYIASKDDNR